MAKGEMMNSQTQPPYGIKRKAWRGMGNRSEHTSKHKPGRFSRSCATKGCAWVQTGTQDKSVKCGWPAPRVCPAGHRFPIGGYVDA